jgi:hypothetical protein
MNCRCSDWVIREQMQSNGENESDSWVDLRRAAKMASASNNNGRDKVAKERPRTAVRKVRKVRRTMVKRAKQDAGFVARMQRAKGGTTRRRAGGIVRTGMCGGGHCGIGLRVGLQLNRVIDSNDGAYTLSQVLPRTCLLRNWCHCG